MPAWEGMVVKLNRNEIARRVAEARRIVTEGHLSKSPPSDKQIARLEALKKQSATPKKAGKQMA